MAMILRALSKRFPIVLVGAIVVGCGGGSSSPPTEPNETFACQGNVSDPRGDSTPLPGGPGPSGNVAPLDICAPPGTALSTNVTHCQTKCQSALSTYATLIDATLPAGTPQVTVSQLTCNISNVSVLLSDCPNTDPPGIPDPLFAGGPAQYVANLSGNVNIAVNTNTVLGTVSQNPGTSGQLAYTILPLDLACPPQGCQLLVTNFALAVNNFELSANVLGVTLFDHKVTNMTIQNVGWITGTWQPNGQFSIPAQGADAVVTLNDNGTHESFDRLNANAITGTINPGAGTVSFDTFSQVDSDTTLTVSNLSGANFVSPPVAVITLPTTIECNQTNAAAVTLDGTASTAPNNDLHFFTWTVNGGAPLSGATVPAVLSLGENNVALEVFNSAFGIGLADEEVNVVDTTPPTIQVVQPVTDTICDPTSQVATVAVPTATDICSPTVAVTGAVISINGVTLTTPIPLQSGSAQLPPGTIVIQWTATDQSGNVAVTTQTLTLRPAIEASDWIALGPKSSVTLPSGAGFAMIGNTGPGNVHLHSQAQTGSILSQGPVVLDERSVVHGDVESAKTVRKHASSTVTGTISANATVPLPAGRDLSSVVFPSSNNGPIDVEPHQSQTPAPGAFSFVRVAEHATLVLTAGTYFVEELDLQEGSRLNLDQSGGPVSLFVHKAMNYDGQIASIAGSPGGFLLGYAGDDPLEIGTPFLAGTLVAPNADVKIPSHEHSTGFTGELFAKRIETDEDATVVCDPVGLSAQQVGLPITNMLVLRKDAPATSAPLEAPSAPQSATGGGCNVASNGASDLNWVAISGLGAAIALWFARRRGGTALRP
jgi:hypothetical protein